jgi:hypothetical protein
MRRALQPRVVGRWFARALIALLVFAQASVAVHACEPLAQGVAAIQAAHSAAADAPTCHEELTPHEAWTNVCAAHCTAWNQISAVPQLPPLGLPDVPVLRLAAAAASAHPGGLLPEREDYGQTGPPPALRFQVLRI